MKKKQESKQEKTITAHEKAFKAAEKKTRHQLSQVSSFVLDLSGTNYKTFRSCMFCELTLMTNL
jgi:hypothetical protein